MTADANKDYRRVVCGRADCNSGPVAVAVVLPVCRSTEKPTMRRLRQLCCGLFGHRWGKWEPIIVHGLFSHGRTCSRCRVMEWEAMP